jgi:hypothetical protein
MKEGTNATYPSPFTKREDHRWLAARFGEVSDGVRHSLVFYSVFSRQGQATREKKRHTSNDALTNNIIVGDITVVVPD